MTRQAGSKKTVKKTLNEIAIFLGGDVNGDGEVRDRADPGHR